MKRKFKGFMKHLIAYYSKRSLTLVISMSFTLVAVLCVGISSVVLAGYFSEKMEEENALNVNRVISQVNNSIETYVRGMMRISDSIYYTAIKDIDISKDSIAKELNVLYEANKDNLVSIACYTKDGKLVAATPVATVKENADVTKQGWFVTAMNRVENLHFSRPHVQNLFDYNPYRYYWVISLSRAVIFNDNGQNEGGVLVVDMNYSGIEQVLRRMNLDDNKEYVYLMDGDGNIIYHPKHKLINAGIMEENNLSAAGYEDGSHDEEFQGEERIVTVKTVGYTGWKIVYVVKRSSFEVANTQIQWFVLFVVLITMILLVFVNQFISLKVAKPIEDLDESVKELEKGNLDVDIYIGGTHEIKHLGQTLNTVVARLRQLMEDVVREQEEKRKSELDALQSQINPHFLYNTLDSIVWMIESERYEEAIFMITQLASLFRISLSKGRNVISIEDELTHAQNYMNIQKVRYRNKFQVEYHIEDSIRQYCTVKLVIQPILENAIYYGMEAMDGDGLIQVKGFEDNGKIQIHVIDNGLGMSSEQVEGLLSGTAKQASGKKGSGVGLCNVHQRIRLRFGEEYGLKITSVPDEGTDVCISLPMLTCEEYYGKAGGKND